MKDPTLYPISANENDIKSNISQFSNEKLSEIIVSYKYLGVMKDAAIFSMEELASRRAKGDRFNYEAKIEDLLSTLPKLNTDLKSLFKIPGNIKI
jgi:hypothetical protein